MTLATHDLDPRATLRMTIEEFDRLPDRERFELVHGKITEKNMGAESDLIAGAIVVVLSTFVRQRRLGQVFPETDYVLDPDDRHHFRRPDASFVSATRFVGGMIPTGRMTFAPDLAVEVVSPHDLAVEVEEKVDEYLRLGVRLVWLVFPATRTVRVYTESGEIYVVHARQDISGEEVLPGFSCPVSDFFPHVSA